MVQGGAVRFDDLVMDAVGVIQALVRQGARWEAAELRDKGRVVELWRGLAGERRYAIQARDSTLLEVVDNLKESARAQIRLLEGNSIPGDEELASRLDADAAGYAKASGWRGSGRHVRAASMQEE